MAKQKMVTREITSTTIKVADMQIENGQPVAVALPDEVLIGNVTLEKAQKELNKKYGRAVTVFGLTVNTHSYEMPVETFLAFATIKTEQEELELV
jgi:hypothetical protein